jgi:hypothetical protein
MINDFDFSQNRISVQVHERKEEVRFVAFGDDTAKRKNGRRTDLSQRDEDFNEAVSPRVADDVDLNEPTGQEPGFIGETQWKRTVSTSLSWLKRARNRD